MATSQDKDVYVMEENEGELQRLANQHEIITKYLGTLALAPVDFSRPNLRILDSGTADGLWLRELRDSNDTPHTYVGTDITEAWLPKDPPPEFRFHVQSITQPWPQEWTGTFDYVHQRLTLAGVGSSPLADCITSLARLVKPGGYLELVDADFGGESPNGPAARHFERLMAKFLDTIGIGYTYANGLPAHVETAGLVTVQSKTFVIKYGAACEDPALGAKGVSHLLSASVGMQAFLRGQPNSGIDQELPADFLDQLKRELEEIGASFKMIAVWARKPE
ncbi:hypothetical protein PFICI_09676 [Pestalotiopsis fici W106-1]|uniref:Methyltransferase domain-containing protein n=1 Tax=Pestalotiopsis fici (strain W106-1 / CGMCC3.15140) TaxID=1229662 RepID=W3WUX3_PESFW|nr:uncharacterized protein PFICI_09676 [Pestalotiopsis fici W106-1]ETS77614.1 hypothetical protein PFICI_09676 [Pestalotiopsis fici W106-1]